MLQHVREGDDPKTRFPRRFPPWVAVAIMGATALGSVATWALARESIRGGDHADLLRAKDDIKSGQLADEKLRDKIAEVEKGQFYLLHAVDVIGRAQLPSTYESQMKMFQKPRGYVEHQP
jgi:hypothetical protein